MLTCKKCEYLSTMPSYETSTKAQCLVIASRAKVSLFSTTSITSPLFVFFVPTPHHAIMDFAGFSPAPLLSSLSNFLRFAFRVSMESSLWGLLYGIVGDMNHVKLVVPRDAPNYGWLHMGLL